MPTPQQIQEAIELGYDESGIGAVAMKGTVVQITLSFKPPFKSLEQFRQVVKKLSLDGGAITSLNTLGAVVVATLEPGDLPALRPGRALFKIGTSTVSVIRTIAK